jgi:predicted acyltransferase
MASKLILRKLGIRDFIYERFLTWPSYPELGSLAFALAWLLLWIVVGAAMYRRGIIVKV